MFNANSEKREFKCLDDLKNVCVPRNSAVMFSYLGKRISIESEHGIIEVRVLSNYILASGMPDFYKEYGFKESDEKILGDLKEYFLNKKINKK